VRVLLDAPERGEKVGRFEREGGRLDRIGIGGDWRQHLRAPAVNSSSLAASSAERKGRGER
jgi:hypothetical protein